MITRVLTGAAALAFAHASPAPAQEAAFMGGPAHTGVYQSAVRGFGGIAWRVQTDGPVRASPVIAAGTVYVGSTDGSVRALDLVSGRERWRAEAGSPVSSSAAVSGGLVFVVGRDGTVLAFEAATGRRRWRVVTGPDAPLAWGLESGDLYVASPVVAGGLLVVAGGDGQLRALDPRSGRERWRRDLGARLRSSPAVADGMVVVGTQRGRVVAVDLATGASRWTFATVGDTLRSADWGFDRTTVQSSPAIADGVVFVGARDGFLYALDLASGTERWRRDYTVSWVNSTPAVHQGRVVVGTSDGRYTNAVDAASGNELWRDSTDGIVWASAGIAGGSAFIGDGTGLLSALDLATGARRWRARIGGRLFSSPAIADGLLVIGGDDGGITALRLDLPAVYRAVFFDTLFAQGFALRATTATRDWFQARGYEVLDAAALPGWLAARASDRVPSVLVCAGDVLPTTVVPVPDDTVLLRRYLDAGGKVVWRGLPPTMWPRDPVTNQRTLKTLDRSRPARLLGVGFSGSNFDLYAAAPTAAGRAWGLNRLMTAAWSADTAGVEVLARDELGLAAAWVRRYGGSPGTGFVRIPLMDESAASLEMLYQAAERRPRG